MNIFLKADDKSFTLCQTLNETTSILLKKQTCILICQIEPGVHEILPTVIVFDRNFFLLIEFFFVNHHPKTGRRQGIWSDVIRIFHKTNQKTILKTKGIILHVEWSFVSANQWKKKNKHFIHLYTDDKNLKYRFSIISLQAENMSIHIESNLASRELMNVFYLFKPNHHPCIP